MGSLLKLAAKVLIVSRMAGRVRATSIRMAVAALCACLAAVLAMAALGCVATALWIVTLPSLGAVGAPLVVAASLSGLVVILLAAARLMARRGRGPSDASITPQLPLLEATRFFTENKSTVLLAAVLAGMAAANGSRKP